MPKRLFTFSSGHRILIIHYLQYNHVQNLLYNEYFLLLSIIFWGGGVNIDCCCAFLANIWEMKKYTNIFEIKY